MKNKRTPHKQVTIIVGDCAFLRRTKRSDGSYVNKCLFHNGILCPNAQGFPYAEACECAIRRAYSNKQSLSRYWKSLKKHHLVPAEAKKKAFAGQHAGKEEYYFCKRKRRYNSEKQAEENRKWCERQRGVPLRVLFCPYCNGWHLTHKYAKKYDVFGEKENPNQ